MATLNLVSIAIQGKGVLGTLRRAGTIRKRYGLTPKRMERTLSYFINLLREFECGATFPIPATTLVHNRGVVERLDPQEIELAAHGYYHRDQTRLSFSQQLEQFVAARRVFKERGIRCDGFRSPYLRANPETLAAIKQAGFVYDSSQALAWEIPEEMETCEYRRALDFYGAVSARTFPALPRWDNDLVRIPCCLPDDEALVDRFQMSSARMTELWLTILKRTHAAGEIFTVALHPERILLCQQSLHQVLQAAYELRPPVWITQLCQVAEWWKKRTQTEVRVMQNGSEETSVETTGTGGVTLLARGVAVTSPARTWDQTYLQADGPELRFHAPRRPFIGVSPASPAYLTSFLRQQGYIVEPAENSANHTFYLDCSHFAYEDERPLLDQIEQGSFPLVRLGRWPNGTRSALCVTGDIDALTIWDYALRLL